MITSTCVNDLRVLSSKTSSGSTLLSQSSSRIRPNKVGMQRQEAIVVDCESVLEFDKSTLTHKILFINKVYDIIVLPLLLNNGQFYIQGQIHNFCNYSELRLFW